jgi:Ser/Thr protein kinase RdoA (MazF antagonist)
MTVGRTLARVEEDLSVGDVTMARTRLSSLVRSLPHRLDEPERPALLSAFLEGYHQVRPLGDDERDVLSLSNTHVYARSLVHGHEVLDAGDPDDPAWLTDLRSVLTEHHAHARSAVLGAPAPA